MGHHLAGSFVRTTSAGYMRSYAFRQTTIQGSIFKLVTAYAGLKQRYLELGGICTPADLRLFDMSDNIFMANRRTFVGYFHDGTPIPQLHKGGRIPKSLHHNIGKIDLIACN